MPKTHYIAGATRYTSWERVRRGRWIEMWSVERAIEKREKEGKKKRDKKEYRMKEKESRKIKNKRKKRKKKG